MPDTVWNMEMNVSWPLLFKELWEQQWEKQTIYKQLHGNAKDDNQSLLNELWKHRGGSN